VPVPDGTADVAGDDLLHQLDDPHARPRLLGPGDDVRRRCGARAGAGQVAQSLLVVDNGGGARGLGVGDPASRAERLVLRPLGVSPSRDRLDRPDRRALPVLPRLPARIGRASNRVRTRLRRHLGLPLLGSRHGTDLRPPLAASRAAAPMRRLALVGLVALVLPASAFAHANLDKTSPKYRERLQTPPRAIVLHFDQSIQAEPNGIEVKNDYGKLLSGITRASGQVVRVPLKRLPRGAYTVRWHVLSLALLLGGIAFRLLLGRRELPEGASHRFYAITGIGAVATLEVGIVAFIL